MATTAPPSSPSPSDGFRYDAFISYSRRNLEVADTIERELQKFPLTREVRKQLRRRHLDIFRDVNDLTGNRLAPALEDNLRQSRTLIVLCSPAARASIYVGMEITRFAELRDADRIVPVLVDGMPNNDAGTDPAQWAFPDALSETLAGVPLAPDMRQAWMAGSRKARLAPGSPWIQLVSGIVGVTPDDLTERISKAERRRLQTWIGVLATVLTVVTVLAGVAWFAREEAVRQSLIATTRQLAATAQVRAPTDLQSALLLADTAYRTRAEPPTVQALHDVLSTTPQLVGFYDFGETVPMVDGTPDGAVLAGGAESGAVRRLDRAAGTAVEVMRLDLAVDFLAISDDGRTIAASGTRYDENWVQSSQSAIWRDGLVTDLPGRRLVALSPSGRTAAAQSDDALEILTDGTQTARIATGPVDVAELPDDATVVAVGGGRFTRASVDGSDARSADIGMAMPRGGQVISADGSRFGYSSGYKRIEVFDVGSAPPPDVVDARLAGVTGNANISAITLNRSGTRLATAADGSLFVSEVGAGDAPPQSYTELRGAGPQPHSLRFLSDDVLLSASGSSAALWDLTKTFPLATAAVPAELPWGCGICEPSVIASPDAARALITADSGRTVVNLASGGVRVLGPDPLFDGRPAMVWLDPDRVFVYATASGTGTILSGDGLDVVDRTFPVPRIDGTVIRTALRDDGTVAVLTDQGLVLADPEAGGAELTGLRADALTSDGAYAVGLQPEGASTRVEVIDVSARRSVTTLDVDGALAPFVEHTGNKITLLRIEGKDASVLTVQPGDGSTETLQQRLTVTLGADEPVRAVSSSAALLVKETGEIARYSLADASRLGLFPIASEFQAFNALALNRDGTALIVASQPLNMVFRVPVTAEAWSALACDAAGRGLAPGELAAVVDSAGGLAAGCPGT